MTFKPESNLFLESLTKAVENAVEHEFQDNEQNYVNVSANVLTRMAAIQVQKLRNDVVMYDNLHRPDDHKPCKNHPEIADRIVEELEHELQCSHIPRAYAYKTLFIMYLLFERMPSYRRRSWWEKKFMKGLPDYLEKTDYFKGVDCRYRLSVVLSQIPDPGGRLNLDFPIAIPKPRPNYPPIEKPIVIMNNPSYNYVFNYIEKMENKDCQQFYAQVSNSTFQR